MKNYSIWQNYKMTSYPRLEQDIEVDILIIGGGLTGINTLYQLKNDKRKIALVEKLTLGSGATQRSSAKATYLQSNIYTKLKNTFSEKTAYLYYESQKDALKKLKQVIRKENIDCDFIKTPSILGALTKKEIAKVKREEALLKTFKVNVKTTKLKDYLYAFQVDDTYVFHPLKYLDKLAKLSITDNHYIYENTLVYEIIRDKNKFKCLTKKGVIKAKQVVIATHYPNFLIPFMMPLKCYLEKSLLICTPASNLNYSSINVTKPILSKRYYLDNLITVTNSHNLCFDVDDLVLTKNIANKSYVWTNYDLMTKDNLPYIGKIAENLYLATGYNTWGILNSMLASIILKDLLNNKDNKYQDLTNPKRAINLTSLGHYVLNSFSNTYAFLNSYLVENRKRYHKNPYFTKENNQSIAIYKDNDGKIYKVESKCPHLKCKLIFNELEKTWDCPCHGSRFNIEGKCITGPSNYDITYKD